MKFSAIESALARKPVLASTAAVTGAVCVTIGLTVAVIEGQMQLLLALVVVGGMAAIFTALRCNAITREIIERMGVDLVMTAIDNRHHHEVMKGAVRDLKRIEYDLSNGLNVDPERIRTVVDYLERIRR